MPERCGLPAPPQVTAATEGAANTGGTSAMAVCQRLPRVVGFYAANVLYGMYVDV
jgi:hypothetical protein